METYIPRSTNIDRVDYDRGSGTMTVTFKDGNAYSYTGVDAETFSAMQRSPSAGSFFYRNIRNRFPAEQV